jgi:hypothetical protein
MLCIQVTKDRSPQLVKFCDIAELIRSHERLNCEAALRQAKRLGCRRMVLFGLSLTSNLLPGAFPHDVMRELQFHPYVNQLVEHASGNIFQTSDTAISGRMTSQRVHWLVRERLRDKLYPYYLRYVRGVIVPCELDRQLLPLPGRLSFLYWFFRPMRLIAKYGAALLTRIWVSLVLMSPGRVKPGGWHD